MKLKKNNFEITEHVNKFMVAKFRALRKAGKIDQEEMGQMLGLTRTSVINIEKGRQYLSMDKVYMLCCLFGCQPNDFFPEPRKIEVTKKEKEMVVVTTTKIAFYDPIVISDLTK